MHEHGQKPILEALISLMGLVSTFFGITSKQRLLPGYAGEIPTVTTARKTSTLPEIDADSGDLQREKVTKSSEKEKGHSLREVRVL